MPIIKSTRYILHFFIFIILSLLFFPENVSAYNELRVVPVTETIKIQSGSSSHLELKVEIPDGSYIYGNPKGPGIGRPTTIEVKHPKGLMFKNAVYEDPEKYRATGDPNFVWIYRDETRIHIPFTVIDNCASGDYKITVLFNALLCNNRSCTLHDLTVDFTVKVNTGTDNSLSGNSILSVDIIAADFNDILMNLPELEPRYLSNFDITNIIQAIIYGILAGILLNFMPCVLPVISLKILDIIRYSGQNRREIRKMGIIFSAGILTTFAVLASLVAFLGYSWGGLFQHSAFLIIMIAVIFALALSMFEVFTINIPSFAGKAAQDISNKYLQTYSKGLLATLLATPCSGPFLGGTLAWASIQTPFVIFITFISVGLGMSLPYLLLTSSPRLLRFIPKPGKWMIVFENIMGFLLLGTAVYLLWILEQDMMMPTILFLLFVGLGLWQYGRFGSIDMPRKKRNVSRAVLILIIVCGYFVSYHFIFSKNQNNEISDLKSIEFSQSRLLQNRENNTVTIIDFTADWCPNCKLVEQTSLLTKDVMKIIKDNSIDLMTADLTRGNPEASGLLSNLGSRSIPFLAVFPGGDRFIKPVCLRDIYSEKEVIKAIKMALKETYNR